jgi:hypothetical protein
MILEGKFKIALDEQNGQGKNGKQWRKRSFVIETLDDKYPKTICFDVWGDKCDQLNAMSPGDLLEVNFDIESREFNGKYYTNAKSWKVELKGAGVVSNQPPQSAADPIPPSLTEEDSLPF